MSQDEVLKVLKKANKWVTIDYVARKLGICVSNARNNVNTLLKNQDHWGVDIIGGKVLTRTVKTRFVQNYTLYDKKRLFELRRKQYKFIDTNTLRRLKKVSKTI